jgi:integrase
MARVKDLWKQPGRKGKGKRWLAVWQLGDGTEASKAFAVKDTAAKHASAQETDIARGVYISPKDAKIIMGQFCDTWLAGYRTRRTSSQKAAKVHIAQIKKEFGRSRLIAVRPSRIEAWTARLTVEGYAPSFIYACYRRLAQIMRAAQRDGLIGQSPCSAEVAPARGKQRPFVITTEQLWALHAEMPAFLQVSILLGAMAGLRTGEVTGLRPGDVDLALGMIHPHLQYPAEELKSEASRTAVPIPSSLTTELIAHEAQWSGEWVLCYDDDGRQIRPQRLEEWVRKARAKVPGLPADFRFHDLRHYLASYLIAHGADVKVVQARLRHASASTTLNVYGHLWPDRDESTRGLLEAIFDARPEQRRNMDATFESPGRSEP